MTPIHVLIAAISLFVSTTVLAAPPQKQATPANDQIELASNYLKRGERTKALAVIEAAVKADPKPYARTSLFRRLRAFQ